MKKIICIMSFVSILFFVNLIDSHASINTYSKNVVLYNMNDNQILYNKNKDEKIQVASLTKVMTLLVAIENQKDLNKEVTITSKMLEGTYGYAVMGYSVGTKVKFIELLYAAYLRSAADAVNAIVLTVCDDEKEFVNLMNEKSKDLNLTNTHFQNPVGKDNKKNYSTVNDMSKLTIDALKNKKFKKIWTTNSYQTKTYGTINNSIFQKINNLNEQKIDSENITGSKSGFTDEAKHCLITTAKINNIEYLMVSADSAHDSNYSVIDLNNILNYYSENYEYKTVLKKGKKITTIKIKNSNKTIDIASDESKKLYLEKKIDAKKFEYKYNGKTEIKSNTPINTKLGEFLIQYKGKTIYKKNVYLRKKIGFVFLYKYYLYIILIFLIIFIKPKNKKRRRKHK